MPDFDAQSFEELQKEYSKPNNFRQFDDHSDELTVDIRDIFDNDQLQAEYKERMGAMVGRDVDYVLTIMAKMNVFKRQGVKFTMTQLLDLNNDSRELKDSIRDELVSYSKMPVKDFNQNVFLPASRLLIDNMAKIYIEKQQLSEGECMKALTPYHSLVNGLADAFTQRLDKRSDGASEEDKTYVNEQIYYMTPYFNTEAKNRSKSGGILEDGLMSPQEMVDLMVNKAVHNSYCRNSSVKLMRRSEVGGGRNYQENFSKAQETGYIMNHDVKEPRNGYESMGLLAYLDAKELLALSTDPGLAKRLTLRADKSKQIGLYFDNFDLQIKSSNPSEKYLDDLKKSIRLSYREHVMQSNARIKDLGDDGLNENAENIREAMSILNDCTQLFRSSPEYTTMQTRVKELSQTADKMVGVVNVRKKLELEEKFRSQLDLTRNAVEKYLQNKGALGNKTKFKNTYEANRVAAARALLDTLNEKKQSFNTLQKVDEAEVNYNRMITILFTNRVIDRDQMLELEKLKPFYCSAERIELHEKAKSAIASVKNHEKSVPGETMNDIPENLRPALTAHMTADDKKNANFVKAVKDFGKGRKENNYIVENRMLSGLNTAGTANPEKLCITENRSSSDVAKYEVDNIRALEFGKAAGKTAAGMKEVFGMTAKEGKAVKLAALTEQAEKTGDCGLKHLHVMADDIAFIFPADYFAKLQNFEATEEKIRTALENGNGMMREEKDAILLVIDSLHAQNELKKLEPLKEKHTFKTEDFDGAVTQQEVEEAKAARAAKNNITRKPSVTKNENPDINKIHDYGNFGFDEKMQDSLQSPEALIWHEIKLGDFTDERKNQLIGIAVEIREARERLEKNAGANNIYPEAADDMRTLLFAEHLKAEFENRDELNGNRTMVRLVLADKDAGKGYTYSRILTEGNNDPVENFKNVCRSFNFGATMSDLKKLTESKKTENEKKTIGVMRDFAAGNGAKGFYLRCIQSNVHKENVMIIDRQNKNAGEPQPVQPMN